MTFIMLLKEIGKQASTQKSSPISYYLWENLKIKILSLAFRYIHSGPILPYLCQFLYQFVFISFSLNLESKRTKLIYLPLPPIVLNPLDLSLRDVEHFT